MASFLTGAQISAPFTLKAPYAVDSRSSANTIEEVLTQYPASCRYLGMKVFVETENKYYVFSKHQLADGTMSTGLTDDDFRPFEADGNISVDDTISEFSKNPLENRVVHANLKLKQDTLVAGENMDTSPTLDSENPITSGAVASALEGLRGQLNYKGYYATYEEMSNVTDAVLNDWCTVGSDETHDYQKSKYIYDGTVWVYNGEVAETQVEINDTDEVATDEVWSSKYTKDKIDSIYKNYEPATTIVGGKKYIYSYSIYEALVDIPAEENLAWDNTKFELVVGLNTKNVYVEDDIMYISKMINTKLEVNGDILVFVQ